MYDVRLGDDYWSMSLQDRVTASSKAREAAIYDMYYRDRSKGWFSQNAWNAFGRYVSDSVTRTADDVSTFITGQVNSPKIASAAIGASILGAIGFFTPFGAAVGAAGGAILGYNLAGPGRQNPLKLTRDDYEAIGFGSLRPTRKLVDTNAARTMRQATLSAMHNSVYSLRGAIGNEANLLHG